MFLAYFKSPTEIYSSHSHRHCQRRRRCHDAPSIEYRGKRLGHLSTPSSMAAIRTHFVMQCQSPLDLASIYLFINTGTDRDGGVGGPTVRGAGCHSHEPGNARPRRRTFLPPLKRPPPLRLALHGQFPIFRKIFGSHMCILIGFGWETGGGQGGRRAGLINVHFHAQEPANVFSFLGRSSIKRTTNISADRADTQNYC